MVMTHPSLWNSRRIGKIFVKTAKQYVLCFSLVRRAVSVPTTYLCCGTTNETTTYLLFPHIFLYCSSPCLLRNGLSLNLEL